MESLEVLERRLVFLRWRRRLAGLGKQKPLLNDQTRRRFKAVCYEMRGFAKLVSMLGVCNVVVNGFGRALIIEQGLQVAGCLETEVSQLLH